MSRCAKGVARIAKAAGLGRESLYKALSAQGNPEFATVLKVIHALGLKLKVAAWPPAGRTFEAHCAVRLAISID